MKVLIADDNPQMRALLRRLCAAVATETRDCADGDEAIQVFSEFKPDWTVMDLTMPRLGGLAATQQIVAAYPQARIVMITQCRGVEYEQAAREAGACAFLHKENLQSLLSLLSVPTNRCKA